MGTLKDQPNRNYLNVELRHLEDIVNDVISIAAKRNLTKDQAIKIYEIAELQRRNNLYVQNGDAHDEQMAGMGEIFESIATNIDQVADKIDGLSNLL